MKRGQEVKVRMEMISDFVKDMMSDFQKFNNAKVSRWDKATQRVQVKWFGQQKMWFDIDQVEKA